MEAFKVAEKVLKEWKAENGIEGPATGNTPQAKTDEGRHVDVGLEERLDTKTV